MNGRTLLTGATGFVGSHVAVVCRDSGYRLRCTVRPTSDTSWLEEHDVETVTFDLGTPEGMSRAVRDVDTVVHVAGITRAARPEAFRRINVDGTLGLARAAIEAGVRRFVYMSSLAARGPDGADGPVSRYGRSKREAEDGLRKLAEERTRDMELIILRPGGVYGPRDTDLLALFRSARRGWLPIPRDGAPLQPIYAVDVGRAVVAALSTGRVSPGPHPLAEDRTYGWDEVAEGLAAAFGGPVRPVPVPGAVYLAVGTVYEAAGRLTGRPPAFDRRRARDLVRHSWTCDPSPVREALGWSATTRLPEGLGLTTRWYRDAGWL